MKKKITLMIMIILTFCVLGFSSFSYSVFATSEDVTILENNDEILTKDYLDFYAINRSAFDVSNNGGELSSNKLDYAFDRNFNTSFKSSQDNNVDYVEDGETKHNFINYIDVDFKQNVNINRVLYGSESASTFRGYPISLNIYAFVNNSLSLIKTFNSTNTAKMVVFDLGKTINTNKVRFEYVRVSTSHKYVATAREICFLQPEIDEYNDYKTLFTDYSKTLLNNKYNTLEKLNVLEDRLNSNINYSVLQDTIDRAKKVASGEIYFDNKREFSTNANAVNKINQYGNIANYCRNVLKMASFGTNRQVTGIAVKPNTIVKIYVEANQTDPIPQVCFSQNYGHWSKYLSGNYALKIGENQITVPYLKNDNYTIDTLDGGAIYLVNPYTNENQSDNVKIYIEGGDVFPVYKKGDSVDTFKKELTDYYNKMQNSQDIIDICEIVSDHMMLSVSASKGYEIYQNINPEQTVNNWDEFIEKLLNFGGVGFNENDKYYNQNNKHIIHNIRLVQPWAGAGMYAYSEHIGVYKSTEPSLFYGKNFGWGVAHELGHTFDIPGAIVGECSNNMYAKYNETAIEKVASRGNFKETLTALSGENIQESYFNENRYNFLIWWYLESYQNGFYAELENCYRGQNQELNQLYSQNQDLQTKVNSLNSTEKQVFYCSFVLGFDLSYYFDRWGYNLSTSDNVFKISTSTDNFKSSVNYLIDNSIIDGNKKPKLWYQDASQYLITANNESGLYSGIEKPIINKVVKVDGGYNLFMQNVENKNHFGYEVWVSENGADYKNIGFTKQAYYVDNNTYNDETNLKYKIIAYDTKFNASAFSDEKSIESVLQENVCKIGETFYNSLLDAVQNAIENDTIVLLENLTTENITIDKNLTITILDNGETITIKRYQIGNMFTIKAGKTLSVVGLIDNHIVFDGENMSQDGSIFSVLGNLNINYVDFKNCISASNGGIFTLKETAQLTVKNSEIKKNVGLNGGVISCESSSTKATFEQVNFISNKATNHGSTISSMGTIQLTNCEITDNFAKNYGTIYNYSGGILRMKNCSVSGNTASYGGALFIDGYTEITGCNFSNNMADNGGTAYYSSNVDVRTLNFTNCTIVASGENKYEIIIGNGNINFNNTNMLNRSNIYLKGGQINISKICEIDAKFIVENGKLVSKQGLFVNIENCDFETINNASDIVLLMVTDYELQDTDLEKITIINENMQVEMKDNCVVTKYIPPKDDTDTPKDNTDNPKGDLELPTQNNNNNVGLIVGISCGCLVIIVFAILIIVIKCSKNQKNKKLKISKVKTKLK